MFSNYKPGRIDHDEFKDNDFNDVQQPEIEIWSTKPEVLIAPKV